MFGRLVGRLVGSNLAFSPILYKVDSDRFVFRKLILFECDFLPGLQETRLNQALFETKA